MPKRSPSPSTEIQTYDRYAQVVELRAQGHNFAEIATECGYSDASGASKAYHKALSMRPAQNVDQVRQQEAERLEYLWKRTAEVIEHPPLAHSAIGKVIPNPLYRVDPDDKHVSLDGKYLIDESVRIRAVDQYRKLSESYRKLTGADLTQKPKQTLNQIQIQLLETMGKAEQRMYCRECPHCNGAVPAELVT